MSPGNLTAPVLEPYYSIHIGYKSARNQHAAHLDSKSIERKGCSRSQEFALGKLGIPQSACSGSRKISKRPNGEPPPKADVDYVTHSFAYIYIFVVSCTRPGGCDLPLSGCIVRSVEARLKKFFMRIVGAIVTLFPSINEDLLT